MAQTSKGSTATRTGKTSTATKSSAKPAAAKRKSRSGNGAQEPLSPEDRRRMIAEVAYLRAERRGFGPGDPTEDWLEAEREVDLLLAQRTGQVAQ